LKQPKKRAANERIVSAAVDLFSRMGFHGTSTRDIARLAAVNEVTVYRYYSGKRELFVAAVEEVLSEISLGADAVARLEQAADGPAALAGLFGVINDLISRRPELARLLQFASLEMGQELEPVCRERLRTLLDASANYLKRWIDPGEPHAHDPELITLALVSSVVGMGSLFPDSCESPERIPRALRFFLAPSPAAQS